LEEQVLKGKTQATRETYAARVKSVFNSLRMLGVIPVDHHPEMGLPKIKVSRHTPRPISKDQAIMLMTAAREPMREWFMFACLAGLRAIEISRVQGSWLELHADGYFLRVHGKGDTDLIVPCHPKLVELIQSKNVLGRLYTIDNNYLSRIANKEMRRLGIETKGYSAKSRLSFHSCRHFFATSVLAASNNLITTQRLMRHASPTVTARYADLVNNEERKLMDHLLEDINWEDVPK
jgi:integrase